MLGNSNSLPSMAGDATHPRTEAEQRQVAQFVHELEPSTNGPDLPRQEWPFLTDQSALVPWKTLRSGCRKLDSGHGEVSIQPSHTSHWHRADARSVPSVHE